MTKSIRSVLSYVLRATLARFNRTLVASNAHWISENYIFNRIAKLSPDMVLDIGANEGQFAIKLRESGYRGHIISFEPQVNVFNKLKIKVNQDEKWECHQLALGDTNESLSMHVSMFSQSSSLLPIGRLHTELLPNSVEIGKETVTVVTLDAWGANRDLEKKRIFIKMDAQGYERFILAGGKQTISSAVGALVELCFAKIYDRQSKYYEVMEYLEGAGLSFAGLTEINSHPASGDYLWADGLFIRPEHNIAATQQ